MPFLAAILNLIVAGLRWFGGPMSFGLILFGGRMFTSNSNTIGIQVSLIGIALGVIVYFLGNYLENLSQQLDPPFDGDINSPTFGHPIPNARKSADHQRVLNQQPLSSATRQRSEPILGPVEVSAPSDKRELEKQRFSNVSELVKMHMLGARMLFEDEIEEMSVEQQNLYLAFELGVIEYAATNIMGIDPNNAGAEFANLLLHYANFTYGAASEDVFQIWKTLTTQSTFLKERESGFDSINESHNADGSQRAGHFPGAYLKDAVGF